MIIKTAGYITERILLLGTQESCVYLLDGSSEYALIGGGMIHTIPDIIAQLEKFEINEDKISQIVVLHAHFDHCGVVPYFKKRWPAAKINASPRAKELLATPKVIQSMDILNKGLLHMYNREKEAQDLGIDFSSIHVDEVLQESRVFHCGDLQLEVLEVPGHSSCSIALYSSTEKALFASDAGGIPSDTGIFCAANSNFDKYQHSLIKMAIREINFHLPEHYGALTDDHARSFLPESIKVAAETRAIMEESISRTRDVNKSTEEITNRWIADGRASILSRDVTEMVVGQMFRYLAKQFQ